MRRIEGGSLPQEEAIKTAKLMMAALTAVFLLYTSISMQRINLSRDFSKLIYVEIISTIVALENSDLARSPMAEIDIGKYFYEAVRYVFSNTTAETYTNERLSELGFSDDHIDGVQQITGLPVRGAPLGQCDAAEISLKGEDKIVLSTFIFENDLQVISLDKLTAISLSGCLLGEDEEIVALRFVGGSGQIGYIIPSSILVAMDIEFYAEISTDPIKHTEFSSGIPEQIGKFLKFSEDYDYITSTALKSLIINLANTRNGRFYSQLQFSNAVDSFFDAPSTSVSWQGIVAPINDFIRFAPILIFVILWELWRALKLIPRDVTSSQFWLANDSKDVVGLAGSYTYASAPLIFSIVTAFLYVESQGLHLDVLGYKVDPISFFTLNFSKVNNAAPFDLYSFIMMIISLLFFSISFSCTRRLAIIATTAFSNRSKRKLPARPNWARRK